METSARQRFIDPIFAALGWDVADRARRGPYADVLLEYRLRGGDRPTNDDDQPGVASTGGWSAGTGIAVPQSASERTIAGRRVDGLARRLEDLVLDLYGISDL